MGIFSIKKYYKKLKLYTCVCNTIPKFFKKHSQTLIYIIIIIVNYTYYYLGVAFNISIHKYIYKYIHINIINTINKYFLINK